MKDKMKKLIRIAVIFMVVASLSMPLTALAAGSQPITRTFQPSSVGTDSYIDDTLLDQNYGGLAYMYVQQKNPIQRSLVQFDLSSIPVGSTISSATLSLYASTAAAARTYGAYRITATWVETTVTYTNQPTTAGTATATAASGTTMNFTVTADLQDWIETPTATNWGWMVMDESEGTGGAAQTTIYTREEGTLTTLRPKLAVTFTPVWDSYRDQGRATGEETFTGPYGTVYMKGTGFLDLTNTYDISYYDGGGTKIATDAGIALVNESGGRGDLGNTGNPYEPTYTFISNPSAQPGTWNAVVQPSGATSFDTDYTTVSANPDTYDLIADDTFTVQQDVIPEFPTVMAAIGVAGLCFGIYFWMRKRYRKQAAMA